MGARVRTKVLCAWVMLGVAIVPSGKVWSDSAQTPREHCGTGIPADEAIGFVSLPAGDVFCPLIADPKAVHSYFAYLQGTSSSPLGTELGSVGIGDRFGVVRWG